MAASVPVIIVKCKVGFEEFILVKNMLKYISALREASFCLGLGARLEHFDSQFPPLRHHYDHYSKTNNISVAS